MRIGTAGWSIPRALAGRFGHDGTHLQRYSHVLTCAEINSSFHRPHSVKTYAKWADATPDGFMFSVKLPRAVTHDLELKRARKPLEEFLRQSSGLREKRGPLVQLPPSFACDRRTARAFFTLLRARHRGPVVLEPRHPTWFSATIDAMLAGFEIARAGAHPAPVPGAERPGGWPGLVYYRLHGAPRKYWSPYSAGELVAIGDALRAAGDVPAWCIFDNTASGAAPANALELAALITGT